MLLGPHECPCQMAVSTTRPTTTTTNEEIMVTLSHQGRRGTAHKLNFFHELKFIPSNGFSRLRECDIWARSRFGIISALCSAV